MLKKDNKARALQQAVEGSINQMWTITALQLHPRDIIACDEVSCIKLKVGTYNYFKDPEKTILTLKDCYSENHRKKCKNSGLFSLKNITIAFDQHKTRLRSDY
jgi:hypothetical protein